MVATRRGARVCSPTKSSSEEPSGIPATPSRRTRRTTTRECPFVQCTQEENPGSLPDNGEATPSLSCPGSPNSSLSSVRKRCTKASRCHPGRDLTPSTPVDFTHEADVSDLESCSSVVSGIEPLTTRRLQSRRKQQQTLPFTKREATTEEDLIPEANLCLPAILECKGHATRSARRKVWEKGSDETAGALSEAESCSSVVSECQRQSRTSTRLSMKQKQQQLQLEEEVANVSDLNSHTSSASGAQPSTTKVTRSRRGSTALQQPIIVNLDGDSEGSESPVPGRKTARVRGKPMVASRVKSETQSWDSEGFESGPSMTPRRSARKKTQLRRPLMGTDSESDLTDIGGLPTRGQGTPCSSRTGSSSSSTAPASRRSARAMVVLMKKCASIPAEMGDRKAVEARSEAVHFEVGEDGVLDDSELAVTSVGDADCTIAEDQTLMLEEDRVVDEVQVAPDVMQVKVGSGGSIIVSSPTAKKEKADGTVPPHLESEPGVVCESERSIEGTDVTETTEKEVVVIRKDADEVENVLMVQKQMGAESIVPPDSRVKAKPVTLCISRAELEPVLSTGDHQREPFMLAAEGEDSSRIQETEQPAETEISSSDKMSPVCGTAAVSVVVQDVEAEEDDAMEVDLQPEVLLHTEKEPVEASADILSDEKELCGSLGPVEPTQSQAEQALEKSAHVTTSRSIAVPVSGSEHAKESVTVKKTGVISLMYSSEDENDSDGDDVEEDVECVSEGQAGSSKPGVTASSLAVDGLFMIDTKPGLQANDKYYRKMCKSTKHKTEKKFVDQAGFVDEEGDEDEDTLVLFSRPNLRLKDMSSRIDPALKVKELGGLYINFQGGINKPVSSSLKKLKEQKLQEELMKKSVIGPDFEKKEAAPPYRERKEAMKLKRKAERDKTTGDAWFNMKAPELTDELKGDLKALKMRGAMDPKRFYKKNDRDGFPKYFQMGTVVDNPLDFYHSRIPKKQRKRTIVEELLVDAEYRHNNKKKYQKIMMEKAAQAAGKKNKNKKKKNAFKK